jgi:membrane peptidoglycan carboxypeptidase
VAAGGGIRLTRVSAREGDHFGVLIITWRLAALVAVATAIGVLVAGLVMPVAGLVGVTSRAVATNMDKVPVELSTEPLRERSQVLDRDGEVVATFYDQNRKVVPLKQIAPMMRRALIAVEDERFFEHGAIDLRGTLRAFVQNQSQGGTVQGGSTITQQLVKMTLVDQADDEAEQQLATERSYRRKVAELRHAIALEKQRSKRWILARYLNTAYFGDGVYGVQTAAQRYFSKPARDLDLREAAMLAGLVKNPTRYDPTNSRSQARQRRNVVLARMQEAGMITPKRAARASRAPLGLELRHTPNGCLSSEAPWFCSYLRQYLLRDPALGDTVRQRENLLRTGGLRIHTKLDQPAQRAADRAVRNHVNARDRAVGALAVVEPGTGAVRAVAQSRPMGPKAAQGQSFLNFAVPQRYGDAAGFQPGSTFKAFVLAAAIERGIPLDTEIRAPQRLRLRVERFAGCQGPLRSDETWTVSNSTGSGTFDLYEGTQQSVNTFFARLELRTGLCRPYRLAQQMGIGVDDPDSQQVPSFTLGVASSDVLTMAGAYATFAARGRHCESTPLRRVLDRDGEVVVTGRVACRRVLPRPVADAVNDVLRGVQEPGGFGHSAGISLDRPSAGKTGTTNSNRAVWFVGYTPDLAAAAMIAGADRQGRWTTLNGQRIGGSYVARASGSRDAGPIWAEAMRATQGRGSGRGFTRPDPDVVRGTSRDRRRGPDPSG